MGQDWKTLSIVVLGAALVGWLMVRTMMTAPPPEQPHRAGTAVSAPVAETPATPLEEAAAPTAGLARPRATASPAGDTADADLDVIVRDLEVLSQALVRDQRIEDRVLPRINDALDVPGVTAYRRAPDFWEPALASSEGANR